MKLYQVAEQKIEDDYSWNDFSEHYYCPNSDCLKVFHVCAKGLDSLYPSARKLKQKDWTHCPDCLHEVTKITDEMIEASKQSKDGKPLVFTPEERKEIFGEWWKSIQNIPTQNLNTARTTMRKKRTSNFA